MAEAVTAIAGSWRVAREGVIPPTAGGFAEMHGCSLAPICLPDEVNRLGGRKASPTPINCSLFAAEEAWGSQKIVQTVRHGG